MTYVHFKIKTNQYDVKIRNSYQSLMYFAKNLTLFEQGEFFQVPLCSIQKINAIKILSRLRL